MPEFITIKIWKQTLHKLRIIAAIEGASMVVVLDRIIRELYNKVKGTR